jgi:hypothetical protein
MDWVHVAQDRNQWQTKSCEHGNDLSGIKKDRTFFE